MLSQKNWSDIFDAAISIVIKSPKLLFVVVSARLSGELWIYLYIAYYKASGKNHQYINTHFGKTVVGLVWMAAVFVPLYYLFYGLHQFKEDDAMDMVVTVVIYSMFIELVVTLATVAWRTPR